MSQIIHALLIGAIRADDRLQMRVMLNDEHVDDIVEALAANRLSFDPAPVIFKSGADYWLADGFHRLAAHKKAGLTEMRCDIRVGDFHDALRHALGANQHTSLKRTNADKRKAVMTALADEEIAKMSNVQIADLCGVSSRFVDYLRADSTSHCSKSTRRVTRNGRIIDTANIGKTPRSEAPADTLVASAKPFEDTPALAPTVTPPAKSQVSTDPFGRPLTGDLVDVFEHRTAIMSMVAELENVKGRIKNLHAHHGGEFMPWASIEYQLSAAQKQLEATAPQAVCPDCGGVNPLRATCRTCDESGFVAAGKFTQLAPVLQQKAKAFDAVRGKV